MSFEHVTFAYHDEPVLRDVSFRVAPGERVAFVGHTGAGKTTILRLLARFYEPQRGRILVDGVDIRELARSELRRHNVPELKMKPSEYFQRQGWISFDTDEHALQFTANDKLVGADRIIWASDFPHPDAKYPGTVKELIENTEALTEAQKARVYGENARELYGLPIASREGKVAR